MNRRRHNSEGESSLELLLDTMCNTFGGVMFIAISLFIIISAFPPDAVQTPSMPPVEESDPVKLQEELESLQTLLESKRQERQLLEEELKRKQERPLQRKALELALLERMIHEEELTQEAKDLQLEVRTQEWTLAAEALSKAEEALRELEMRKAELDKEKLRLTNELAQLKARPAEQISMEFKVMEPSKLDPFFIILDGTDAWPVGPWRSADGTDVPDGAVSTQEFSAAGHREVHCQILPGKGIPVLSNQELSAEFQNLLRRIPTNQVPDFYVHSTAAATVSRMREILKRQNKLHGCTPAVNDADDFVYHYVDKVDYEY